MIGKISDYGARDEIAERVGEACIEHDKVVGFLQGAYFGLRDIDFQQWDNAFVTCEAENFESWMLQQVQNPPDKLFDEKWNTLARSFVKRNGSAALPILTTSAVAAAEAGPFETILTLMEESVAPGFGSIAPDDQTALTNALLEIGRQVSPSSARSIADRLLNAGDEASAASLMPSIYLDAVQSDGGFLYGAVSIEACEDEQSAVIHTAVVHESGEHYLLQGVADEQMRAFKSRQKCDVGEPWPVVTSPEPLNSDDDLDAWVAEVQTRWEGLGYSIKLREEKDVSL